MKKQGVLLIVTLILISAFSLKDNLGDPEIGKRGAMEKEELPEVVFNAMKINDFGMLLNYIPNESELEYLKEHTSRKNQYIYESMSAELLKANTQLNFQKVVEEGIKKGINWSSIDITDNEVKVGSHTDQRIYKGIFTVQDIKGKSMKVSFDIIKVKNKWFLFQGMRVES